MYLFELHTVCYQVYQYKLPTNQFNFISFNKHGKQWKMKQKVCCWHLILCYPHGMPCQLLISTYIGTRKVAYACSYTILPYFDHVVLKITLHYMNYY